LYITALVVSYFCNFDHSRIQKNERASLGAAPVKVSHAEKCLTLRSIACFTYKNISKKERGKAGKNARCDAMESTAL